MTRVLVWAEESRGSITSNSLELLGLGQRLANGDPVSAVMLSDAPAVLTDELIASGADRVYLVKDKQSDEFHPDVAVHDLSHALHCVAPEIMLLPHSDYGAELGPRIAFREKLAVGTGCSDIDIVEGRFRLTRSCYGGKAQAVVTFRNGPGVATVRPKTQILPDADTSRRGEVSHLNLEDRPAHRIRVRKKHREVAEGPRLEDAAVIIAGGRGLGGAAGFEKLEELAQALGGVVGASRPACDMGWYPHSHQIGISGRTVAPELYIAVGISGADHHLAGCSRSKLIVAINNDPDANIFKYADVGIVVDYSELVAEVIADLLD
ncbi:MAG: electron transfer flavoprotein subunit alpha/FixB family protein [Pseudomonadales bacterium]|jgi:electron transfer flavoprotein alpha subunit|nr:electron transfer flavoprotein subunit alpha/FixB family protein [Pseudomonadales bacterium]